MLVSGNSLVNFAGMAGEKSAEWLKQALAILGDFYRRFREGQEKKRSENRRKERREFKAIPIVLKDEVNEGSVRKPKKKPPPFQEQFELPQIGKGYMLPPVSLLDFPAGAQVKIDREALETNSIILQKKLADFGVDGEVVAVCILDDVVDGYSAVYTFFAPEMARQSVGSFMILALIARDRREGKAHVYLGYWIDGGKEMDYKARFRPLEAFGPKGWKRLPG